MRLESGLPAIIYSYCIVSNVHSFIKLDGVWCCNSVSLIVCHLKEI